ncbi:hypothetical protein [Xenorhabdus bovienii]|uniref:hypothetical protein n=1 Tax=Xenorhabdus bovienii TaxID=40576 RepID=UPI003DA5F2D4
MLNIIIAYIFISTRNGFISTHFGLAVAYPISAGEPVFSNMILFGNQATFVGQITKNRHKIRVIFAFIHEFC